MRVYDRQSSSCRYSLYVYGGCGDFDVSPRRFDTQGVTAEHFDGVCGFWPVCFVDAFGNG